MMMSPKNQRRLQNHIQKSKVRVKGWKSIVIYIITIIILKCYKKNSQKFYFNRNYLTNDIYLMCLTNFLLKSFKKCNVLYSNIFAILSTYFRNFLVWSDWKNCSIVWKLNRVKLKHSLSMNHSESWIIFF